MAISSIEGGLYFDRDLYPNVKSLRGDATEMTFGAGAFAEADVSLAGSDPDHLGAVSLSVGLGEGAGWGSKTLTSVVFEFTESDVEKMLNAQVSVALKVVALNSGNLLRVFGSTPSTKDYSVVPRINTSTNPEGEKIIKMYYEIMEHDYKTGKTKSIEKIDVFKFTNKEDYYYTTDDAQKKNVGPQK